jgi:pimeloyl-ACP methyl ester carboxylesterase
MTTILGSLGIMAALCAAAPGLRGQRVPSSVNGRYATVNGLRMFYEIHGSGQPLVLLPGALSTIETSFGAALPLLAKTRRVIAVELQAQGRTSDREGPLSYEQMADDVDALLGQLGVPQADFFGYSLGGGVAVQLAVRHPNRVRKFVFAGGTAYSPDGFYPELIEAQKTLKPENLAGSPYQLAYARVAPQPDHWPDVIAKIKDLDQTWKGFPAEQLRAIAAPALLVIGDADIVRPEHTVEMFRLLGGGVAGDIHGLPRSQLAVLPGTTHVTLVDRTDWLVSMVMAFLDAPMPVSK